jgi:hypothetical protein
MGGITMNQEVIKDEKYWENLFAPKTYVKPERNFKFIETQSIGYGTHITLYTEYGKFIVAFRKEMTEIFWEKREFDNQDQATECYKELVKHNLNQL